MKRHTIFLSLCFLTSYTQAVVSEQSFAKENENPTASYQAKEIALTRNLIVFYNSGVGNEALLQAVTQYGATLLYHYNTLNGIAIAIPPEKNLDEAIRYFANIKGVLAVNREQVLTLH